MTFDYDRAWRDTRRLFSDHRALLLGIAGVFFFLPYAALLLALPHFATMPPMGADMTTMSKAMQNLYADAWWAFALLLILLVYGTLSMLALMKLRARPTVGEALRIGAGALPSYLLALVIQLLGIELVMLAMNLSAAATGVAPVVFVVFGMSLFLQLYFFVRLAMTAPVMVIEGERKPISALRRSWALTRESGLRICGFVLLIVLAFIVLTLVASVLIGLLLALTGEPFATIGDALLSAAIMTAAFILFACVLAAIFAQLSRPAARHGAAHLGGD